MSFPQLRVRSGYSFKSAYGREGDVVKRLKELECATAGLVDVGTWGHVRWEQAATKAELAPMFGVELPIRTITGIVDDEPVFSTHRPRAWMLAEDTRKFYRASSEAFQHEGLMAEEFGAVSGCVRFPGGALHQLSYNMGQYDYIDLNPSSFLHAADGVREARKTGAPIAITSYNDMPSEDQRQFALAWKVRASVGMRHIASEGEIWDKLKLVMTRAEFDQGVRNSIDIADRLAGVKLAKAPMIHMEGSLADLCEEGKVHRLGRGHIGEWTAEYQSRMELELEQIGLKDFDSYFLVVSDLIRYAKKHMLVGPARGSSAGSLVCYLLGITEIDPLPPGLLFQRFIDISRSDLPDIDIDFSDTKRYMAFDYLQEKFGRANVVKLGNISTLKANSVLAQVGKSFGIPYGDTDQIKSAIIEYSSADERYGKGLEDTLTKTAPGEAFKRKWGDAALCMGDLELHPSHSSVHAAGIVVCNDEISDYCTVNAEGIAQIDKPDSEYLNLLKIDALGLRTLGVIEDAGVISNEALYDLKMDDPKVLQVLNDNRMSGIFQFEGQAVRSVANLVNIDNFGKIDNITALARPGPLSSGMAVKYIERVAGREEITYAIPQMKKWLGDTFGVFLYQEQIMSVVKELGLFDWVKTSAIRKAMSGRKGEEFFNKMGADFVAGAITQDVTVEQANSIWQEMVTFGAWGFNKCLAGDTKVMLAHPNQFDGDRPTIEHLYNRYKANPTAWIRQRKTMPVLLCYDEGKKAAFPVMAKDIVCNGPKACVELEFDNGQTVKCTKDHKFIIDGEWKICGDAVVGSEFLRVRRYDQEKDGKTTRSIRPGGHGWAAGESWVDGVRMELNGKTRDEFAFKAKHARSPCEDCATTGKRMEAHHNDFDAGKQRPADLYWLCAGCHKKRHYANGDRSKAYERGQQEGEPLRLVSVKDAGEIVTYDIEMPDPWHNFCLDEGLVTHNSHSYSYAVVTYWTCYLKCYHNIEFAASCLRSAKDEDQTIAILRELKKEGINYTAIDPEFSDMNWKAVDGRIVGGIMNAKGYGPVKAEKYIALRDAGKLTDKQREHLATAEVQFSDLAEAHTKFGHFYENPRLIGVTNGNEILGMHDVKDRDECLVIAKLMKKVVSDENEPIRVKKRGGQVMKGQTQFLDMMLRDDSVDQPMRFRIKHTNFLTMGKSIAEGDANGSWYLIRAWKLPGLPMFIVKKIKRIDNLPPEPVYATDEQLAAIASHEESSRAAEE